MSSEFFLIGVVRQWLMKRRAARIRACSLFCGAWYLDQYREVRETGLDPALHYVTIGASRGRRPHQLFDPDYFRRQAGFPESGDRTPLEQYLSLAPGRRPSPHPLFDRDWYVAKNPEAAHQSSDPFEHFVAGGGREGLSPHPDFDAAWYLNRYPDVAVAGANPLVHYLQFGAAEGRDPGPWFNGEWYRETFSEDFLDGESPLEHYVRRGREQGVDTDPHPDKSLWWDCLPRVESRDQTTLAALQRAKLASGTSVIIPVYNAPEELRACLDAVAKYTATDSPVIVINDASTDPEVAKVLRSYASDPRFEVHENPENRGYTATVNRGIRHAGTHDVVLLNSDTRVGPGWLAALRLSAYSQERTATATAVSNNSGAFSAPVTNRENPLPKGVLPADFARAVAQASTHVLPQTPTGNGFCMYVRRDCIDEVGLLDEASFPRGYGEENDFCMRARKMGWHHVVDDSTWVFHTRSASFGSEREGLVAKAVAVIQERFPDYPRLVEEFLNSTALKVACNRVGQVAEAVSGRGREINPRVLFVLGALHEHGGTTWTSRDLMNAMDGNVETLLLRCDGRLLEILSYRSGEEVLLDYAVLDAPIQAFPHTSDQYDAVVADWLRYYAVELVHIRHIAHHGLGLVDIARGMHIPVVFSFHDYYSICPTVKLLDENLRFCAGYCTRSLGHCSPELWADDAVPELKHAAVNDWKKMFASMLDKCDALVTTSRAARELLLKNYPLLSKKAFHVIPHGRDFTSLRSPPPAPGHDQRLRILVPGNLSQAKGADIVAELASQAPETRLEIHILGTWLAGDVPEGLFVHGPYHRDQFLDLVGEIRPHLGMVPSIWAETWCHTLTELWAAGLPVIGYDLGAVAERIRETGGGWVLPASNAEITRQFLEGIRTESESYSRATRCVSAWQRTRLPSESCACMGEAYLGLYRQMHPSLTPGDSR